MDIFCINLAARPDRWAWMQEQFAKLGLSAVRIEAVSPADLTDRERDLYCNPRRLRGLSDAEYCTNKSHAKAWRAVVASGKDHALILEDDAILSASLPRFLAAVDAQGTDLDIIRIETFQIPLRYGPVESWVLPDVGLRRCHVRDPGAAGYIVSREAAAWLGDEPSYQTTLIDAYLFDPFTPVGSRLKIRQTDPALCVQLGVATPEVSMSRSNLAPHAREFLVKRRQHAPQRLPREISRWFGKGRRRLIARLREAQRTDISEEAIVFRPT